MESKPRKRIQEEETQQNRNKEGDSQDDSCAIGLYSKQPIQTTAGGWSAMTGVGGLQEKQMRIDYLICLCTVGKKKVLLRVFEEQMGKSLGKTLKIGM